MPGHRMLRILVTVSIGGLLTSCSTGTNKPATTTTSGSAATTTTAGRTTSADPSPDTPDSTISMDDAGQIVTDTYGGVVIDIESDMHGGEPVWEVEVADSELGRIEADVSRASGEIVDLERD